MMNSHLSPTVAGLFLLTGPLTAQITPKFFYSGSAGGSIRIFNSSKVITVTGREINTTPVSGAPFYSRTVSAAGSAVEQRYGGGSYFPFSMQIASAATGHVSYGHIHFSGSAKVTTQGQYFTNAGPTQPQTAYATEEAGADAGLSLTYNDVLHVESATLPAGTPVVVRASLDAYVSAIEKTSTSPVLVDYPPTGPGFPATSAYELVTTATSEMGLLEGEARLTSYQAGVSFPSVDDRFLYPLAQGPHVVNVNAVVGGKITISHSSDIGLSTETSSTGIYAASIKLSSSYDLTCKPVTEGVSLRSESGHNYAPATGKAALMQTYTSPGMLVLTAPTGAIFQKFVTTPSGFDWQDLPQARMLLVPFEERKGVFRVREP